MKKYKTMDELRKDWLLSSHLKKALKANRLGHTLITIIHWERTGVIPVPKRVLFQGKKWRVYTEQGIKDIVSALVEKSKLKTIIRK